MNNFTFYAPTYFAFGRDTENETGKYVKRFGGTKVLRFVKEKVLILFWRLVAEVPLIRQRELP